MKTPALFIDIDGVLIRDIETQENVENIRLIRSAGPALSDINSLSVPVITLLKLPTELYAATVANKVQVLKELKRKLARASARIDALYIFDEYHKNSQNGILKKYKPNTDQIVEACEKFNIDLTKSWMVTDNVFSIITAHTLEMHGTILVKTGKGVFHEKYLNQNNLTFDGMKVEVFSSFSICRSTLKKSFSNLIEDYN